MASGWLASTVALGQGTHTNRIEALPGTPTGTNQPIRLRAAEAKEHAGANAVVTGKVAEVNKGSGLVRLNFDEPFPKQTFTAIVFSHNTNQFGNLEGLKDKTIEVSGRITLYHGRPEIQLQKTNQLRVVEGSAATTTP